MVKAEAVPPGGLTIIPTFDSSITMSPNAQAIEGSINNAIGILESLFSDHVTVQIDFRYSTTQPGGQPADLGNSLSGEYIFPYAAYISSLKADSRTTNDAIAVAHLPASPLATKVELQSALGRALGMNTPGFLDSNGATDTGGIFDGIVTLNSSLPVQFDRTGGISSGNYDAQRVLEHEIDEVLGLGSILPSTTDGNGDSAVQPEDVFRYSSPGVTSLTTSASATSYFSIDGGISSIAGFNQQSGLDYGDWLSPSCAAETITPLVQYAIICAGTAADVSATSPEGIALDVIGYTLRAATITYTISGTISGTGGDGATVALTGAATASTIASSSGAYSFSGLGDGSYMVTPSLSGYTFEPPSQAVTVSGGNQTANFTASATGGGCTNEGANWNPSATTISLGTFCFQAGTSIRANSGFVVNGTANVTFTAGSSITLGPGFDANGTAGATFTAYVP